MSAGGLLPATAQLSRYQVSQRRGCTFQCFSLAKIENMPAASETLADTGLFATQPFASHVDDLANGDKLPVMTSLTCS